MEEDQVSLRSWIVVLSLISLHCRAELQHSPFKHCQTSIIITEGCRKGKKQQTANSLFNA